MGVRYFGSDINKNFYCGLFSGGANTIIFVFPDNVLYLAMKNKISVGEQLYDIGNKIRDSLKQGGGFFRTFKRYVLPSGYFSIVAKVISNTSYFLCQGVCRDNLEPYLSQYDFSEVSQRLLLGTVAGGANSLLFVTPINTIKFAIWNKADSKLINVVKSIRASGVARFYTGLQMTLIRDIIFGIVYESLRYQFNLYFNERVKLKASISNFFSVFIASSMAVIITCPFTYVRNQQCYRVFQPDLGSVSFHLNQLLEQVRKEPTVVSKLKSTQRLLVLNASMIRTALGVVVGQFLFDLARNKSDQIYDSKEAVSCSAVVSSFGFARFRNHVHRKQQESELEYNYICKFSPVL